MALMYVFPKKERIDLGGVPPQGNVLIAVGKNLSFHKVTRRKEFRDGPRLSNIVHRITKQGVRFMVEVPADFVSRNIGAFGAGNAKVTSNFLQAIPRQLTRGHVEMLGEYPSINDVTTKDFVLPVGDSPFGDLHPGGMATEAASISAQI